MNPRCIITTGDPCGVGPEVAFGALGTLPPEVLSLVELVCPDGLIESVLDRCRGDGGDESAFPLKTALAHFEERRQHGLIKTLSPRGPHSLPGPGAWDPGNVLFLEESLALGIDRCLQTGASLVTGPADKRLFVALGFSHAGHTEYLAARTGATEAPVMLFDCREFHLSIVTRHIPIEEIRSQVRPDILRRTSVAVLGYLQRLPGWKATTRSIVVAGVDPHCGEWGQMSDTDVTVRRWVAQLKREGLPIDGPYPADTLFVPGRMPTGTAYLTWYHDQGMIPVKLLAFDKAVNVTLGLPFLRLSPTHGVAYDIAGRGIADHRSMTRAIELATGLSS